MQDAKAEKIDAGAGEMGHKSAVHSKNRASLVIVIILLSEGLVVSGN
jgi:hypothetical protein